MKKLELTQMENVEGGSVAGVVCGVGMLGWGSVLGYGVALSGISAGLSVGVALVWGGISIALCEAVGNAG